MITTNAGQTAVLNSNVRGAVYLIDLEFLSGTQYYTSYVSPIPANGHTYTALGNVVSVSSLRESETLSMEKMTLGLSVVDTGMLAYVIGPATEYRNRNVRIWVQLIDDKWVPTQTPLLRWAGVMDKVRVDRKPNQGGIGSGTIEMTCQRAGLARFRKSAGLRLSHEQQQLDYPGDLGLEYTEKLVSDPPVWLSKAFQKI